MSADLDVIYEDNHLLAVKKPSGLATMGLPQGKPTLLERAKAYVKQKYGKPGNVYLGVVSRLDVPVSGVVLFARTSKAARRLTEQFRARAVQKMYLAVVEGRPPNESQELVDWLLKDERRRRVHIAAAHDANAQEARLTYRRLRRVSGGALLEVDLHTGRKHQIRVQLAHHGFPVFGDMKYGGRQSFPGGIALHAWRLVVAHPTRNEPLELEAPPPATWNLFDL